MFFDLSVRNHEFELNFTTPATQRTLDTYRVT
jgi:hypothetical protein